jgi:phosphoribosylformylglycinamidine cyclo-ligase
MVRACEEAGCALVGGETAQMPGVYADDDFDLVGFAVAAVERDELLGPDNVEVRDVLIGLPSNGLHTNGYSLVRRIFDLDNDAARLHEHRPELGSTLGEELLKPHRSYVSVVEQVKRNVKSIAHITGGGLVENLPRALPDGTAASMDGGSWEVPAIFSVIQATGEIASEEMFQVFNMGLGMVMVCGRDRASAVTDELPGARIVGEVTAASGDPRVIL